MNLTAIVPNIDVLVQAMIEASAKRDGSKSLADFDRTRLADKRAALIRVDASKIGTCCEGRRFSMQVHCSPWTLLALALQALQSDDTAYITLNADASKVRAALETAKPNPAPEAPKGLEGLAE